VSTATATTTPATPDAFDRLGERVADAINPIVVKEVRQGLRTRVFTIFFAVMLAANLLISLVAFAFADEGGTRTGQDAFMAYFVALACVQFFVIPYSAYRSMSREAEEETWVLLTLTGLGPRRILAGKVASFVLQGTLYASAAAPFLLFSYYLNGIDLPTIVVALATSIAYQLFLVALSVSMATLAETRLVRGLLHFVLLGLLLQGLGFGIGGTAGAMELSRKALADGVFWLSALAGTFAMVTTGMLFFELAAARLSLPSEDYARGPRRWYLVQAVGMLAFFLWGYAASGERGVLVAGALSQAAHAQLVGQTVASDRDGMARVHWATGKRFSPFKPGALRGFTVVTVVTLAAGALYAVPGFSAGDPGMEAVIIAAPAFALVYLATPQIVARWVPHPPSQTALMVRVLAFGLFVLGVGLPPLVGELVAEADNLALNLLNPTVGLVNVAKAKVDALPLVLVPWGVALGVTAWAFAVLRRHDVEPLA
jgi:ABC-type transport system involved in multi-copper enzyme maturation permease subunit